MNKHLLSLVVVAFFAAAQAENVQRTFIKTSAYEKGQQLPVRTRQQPMGLQQPATPLEKPILETEEAMMVIKEPTYASVAEREYAEEVKACGLDLNDMQQFLCRLGKKLNDLAYQYNGRLKIKVCQGGVDRSQELAQYYNPIEVGKQVAGGVSNMCSVIYVGDKNNIAEKRAIIREISQFAEDNAPKYRQLTKICNGQNIPQNYLLRYPNLLNPRNNNYCYVYSNTSPKTDVTTSVRMAPVTRYERSTEDVTPPVQVLPASTKSGK